MRLQRRPSLRRRLTSVATLAVPLLALTACSPVWFLTRSDEVALPLRMDEASPQTVSFVPKFPGRRYATFLRFDRAVSFEQLQCLVGYLWEDKCQEPAVPVQFRWIVFADGLAVVEGNAAPRFSRVGWANDYVEVFLGEFYPESDRAYRASVEVTGQGGPLSKLRPKLLILSYYNPLDRSIHVGPGGDSEPPPNNRINLTALRAARYPER